MAESTVEETGLQAQMLDAEVRIRIRRELNAVVEMGRVSRRDERS